MTSDSTSSVQHQQPHCELDEVLDIIIVDHALNHASNLTFQGTFTLQYKNIFCKSPVTILEKKKYKLRKIN
jgi:hypothetical protein